MELSPDPQAAAQLLSQGVGRRTLLRAAAGLSTAGAAGVALPVAGAAASGGRRDRRLQVLQPGTGRIRPSRVSPTPEAS